MTNLRQNFNKILFKVLLLYLELYTFETNVRIEFFLIFPYEALRDQKPAINPRSFTPLQPLSRSKQPTEVSFSR